MVKFGLRTSALMAVLFAVALICAMYSPVWNEIGIALIRALGGDKTVHVLVGALLPISLAYLARLYQASKRLQSAFWLACLSLFAADEFVQSFSPLRSADLSDLAMSGLGWLIGCSCWWLLWLLFHKE